MPHKQVLFRSAAREKILRGSTQLADAIRVTLGPKSKSVLIQKKWGAPVVCNDGVTIAKEFDLKDPEENLGAQVLRQAAEKTGELVGGTIKAYARCSRIIATIQRASSTELPAESGEKRRRAGPVKVRPFGASKQQKKRPFSLTQNQPPKTGKVAA
jgi:TCP-1/cpn60 chaperonin family